MSFLQQLKSDLTDAVHGSAVISSMILYYTPSTLGVIFGLITLLFTVQFTVDIFQYIMEYFWIVYASSWLIIHLATLLINLFFHKDAEKFEGEQVDFEDKTKGMLLISWIPILNAALAFYTMFVTALFVAASTIAGCFVFLINTLGTVVEMEYKILPSLKEKKKEDEVKKGEVRQL